MTFRSRHFDRSEMKWSEVEKSFFSVECKV